MQRDELLMIVDQMVWAGERMATMLAPLSDTDLHQAAGGSFGTLWGTLRHMTQAQEVWLQRLVTDGGPVQAPADVADRQELQQRLSVSLTGLRAWVAGLPAEAGERVLDYRDMKGVAHRVPLNVVLQHIGQHFAYHRGQVVDMLRRLGKPVVSTDFIRFYYERS